MTVTRAIRYTDFAAYWFERLDNGRDRSETMQSPKVEAQSIWKVAQAACSSSWLLALHRGGCGWVRCALCSQVAIMPPGQSICAACNRAGR